MCTKAIHSALVKLSFVEKVEADIKNSLFLITFKNGEPVGIDELKNAVTGAGFSVAKLTLTRNFNNMQVKNDTHVLIDGTMFHFLLPKQNTLNGEQQLVMVDKNFTTAKEFKKFSAATKMSCVQTGVAGNCCNKNEVKADTRIYHVTI
jgi:hypothetical protein